MDNGWIKIHRKIVDWEWYNDPNTIRLFFHLLLKANHKPNRWKGTELQAGQLIVGRKRLAEELRLSEQEIRTSLKKLMSTNEITTNPTNKFTILTICRWGEYQVEQSNEQPTKRPATKQTSNQQLTTNKNDKNENNDSLSTGCETKTSKIPFETFWDAYEKKTGKKQQVESKWNKLSLDTQKLILDYIPKYKDSQPEKRYRKNPLTFLSQEGWTDELINYKKNSLKQNANQQNGAPVRKLGDW